MAKNRDRTSQNLPGGKAGAVERDTEDDGVGEGRSIGVDWSDGNGDKTEVAVVTSSGGLKTSEKNRLDRAEMHLRMLVQEVTALANEGALVGVFRRACAECQVSFNDSNAALWQPLKSVAIVLQRVRSGE